MPLSQSCSNKKVRTIVCCGFACCCLRRAARQESFDRCVGVGDEINLHGQFRNNADIANVHLLPLAGRAMGTMESRAPLPVATPSAGRVLLASEEDKIVNFPESKQPSFDF